MWIHWISRGLLMKQHLKFPCFLSTLKVCTVFIVLTSVTSLACYGGGGGWGGGGDVDDSSADDWETFLNASSNDTLTVPNLDELLIVNLTGIKDPVDRNIKTAWPGWKPSEETQKDWQKWHEDWLEENAKNGEVPWKQKKGKGGAGGSDGHGGYDGPGGPAGWQNFSSERGPGSGWPDLPGWADLGAGSDGAPVPPWAYVPKNVGKPSLCYLPPIKGTCKGPDRDQTPTQRWGFNTYMDECQQYEWSGCGGTRNRFVTKQKCDEHCALLPPPSCSADSGIMDKSSKISN